MLLNKQVIGGLLSYATYYHVMSNHYIGWYLNISVLNKIIKTVLIFSFESSKYNIFLLIIYLPFFIIFQNFEINTLGKKKVMNQ